MSGSSGSGGQPVKTIHHVLDIEASPGDVWKALTDADGLAGWWSTQLETPAAAVGARIAFRFAGDFNPVMEITELTRGTDLGWRCVDGHDNWQDNAFTFQLVALDDGRCRLRFSQHYAVELSDDDYGIYNFNWGYYLESLRLLCTSGQGKPFDPLQP
jgi:uncharacterized protein YndB with AHSA1/START domain